MRAIQYAMLLVITAAGVVGVTFLLELLPFARGVLPEWVSEMLPEIDSPAAGWLIVALISTIVVAALVVGATEKVLERRHYDEEAA